MRTIAATAAAVLSLAGAAAAETVRVSSAHPVEETVTRLTEAAEEAGANVFARVPHSAGAESIGEELAPMTLVIFGNPRVGTPALQADPLAGLVLPLRVLVYEDDAGAVWLAYEDPAEMLTRYDIPADHPVIGRIEDALEGLTGAAAGGG
ncbi:camphor resistance protein CrcB [Rhodobacteraceae bacterium WD3A24]|nr:camphor resistance protein CrcB [Rhodobacteraceae bacterium WD3A24]